MTEADKGGTSSFAGKASDDMDRARQRLEEEKRAAGTLADEARGAVSGLGSRAKEAAVRQGEEVRGEAVSHLRHFADAVRNAGDELAEKEPGVVSDVVREAAHGLERLSDTLAERSPAEIFGSIRDFGRRHPGAFIAGSMLAGFAVARFAAASRPGRRHEPDYASGRGGYAAGDMSRTSSAATYQRPATTPSTTTPSTRPVATGAPGGYPGAGAGVGLGGAGVGGGTGVGSGAGSGAGSAGSTAADVAKTGAAHPNSPGVAGPSYGQAGSSASSTTGARSDDGKTGGNR